ncbi:LacI family DNA-binding transcriptional regulator [Streptomyces sp. NPDC005820]|uniref:LacI family DNA-binding transcriptional regulator n=1 Tax=Streptomyces sp. NPDC005820 TaxID=3157069 RepID=UPI0033ED79CB
MEPARRVTLKDVAAASGVSRATVSFVLNDDPNQTISSSTRERVLRASRELGYVPHGIARALREGSSRIVVLNVDWSMEGNFSRSYIRGLDAELAAHDHVLLVRHGEAAPQSTQRILDAIVPRAVLRFGEAYMDGHEPDQEDWEHGFAAHAALQIRHLAERGHTHIAMALPDHAFPLTGARLHFADETARRLGLAPVTDLVVPRPRESGAAAVRAFLAAHPAVTAIAAFDDDLALRTLTALHDLGRVVPDEVAVIGYDDTEYGALVTPALTTVHIDAEAKGRVAARTVLGLDAADLVMTPGRVIVRDSA